MSTKATKATKATPGELLAAVRIVGAPVKVLLAQVKTTANWTRTEGEDLKIATLAANMDATGQREPVWIRKGTMELVAGNRRVAAARSLGWKEIMAVEVEATKDVDLRANVAENVGASRAEVTTAGLIRAISEYQKRGYSTAQIATELGRDVSTVKAALQVNAAHPAVRESLATYEANKRNGMEGVIDTFHYANGTTKKDGTPNTLELPCVSFASARRIAELPEGEQLQILRDYGHLSAAKLLAKISELRAKKKAAAKGETEGADEGDEGEGEGEGGGSSGGGNGGGKDAEILRLRIAQEVVPALEALAKGIAALPNGHREPIQQLFSKVYAGLVRGTGEEAVKAARRG